jgi:MFS-type transporter involved in bile tolerance (Atg22 family)
MRLFVYKRLCIDDCIIVDVVSLNFRQQQQTTKQMAKKFTLILQATGYLSFSIIFNVLNTIVFSALYPKILEHITHGDKKRYSTAFSNINFVTTLFSAITLPFIGSWMDCAHTMKKTLLVTQYLGIFFTGAIFFLGKLPTHSYQWQETQLALNEILYVLAMFFLRVSVMANNATLPLFDRKHVTVLSLANSLVGFVVNFFGLLLLMLLPEQYLPKEVWGISFPNWWLLIFTVFTLVVSVITFLSPSGVSQEENEDDASEFNNNSSTSPSHNIAFRFVVTHLMLLKQSFSNVVDTVKCWNKKERYYQCWMFLFSYLFYSTAGTVCTLFLGPLFIEIYDLNLPQEVALNLYFKIAMIVGLVVGIVYDRVNQGRISDVIMLVIQNILFGVILMVAFISISLHARYLFVLSQFLVIGFLYSWSLSVSRAVISKLLPPEKKCEFMGLYSTFTYLGISIVSLMYNFLRRADLPTHILILILFIWIIPAYLFLFILRSSINRAAQRKQENYDENSTTIQQVSQPESTYNKLIDERDESEQ